MSLRPRRGKDLATVLIVAGLMAALMLTSGCGSVMRMFGAGDKDPTPPTPLASFNATADARVLWSKRFGKGTGKRRLNLVPALEGGRLYVAEPRGKVRALSASDGRTLWETDTDLSLSAGPEVQGDLVVVGSVNGHLVALSARDGSQRWRSYVESELLSLPTIVGTSVIVHALDDNVYALSTADGSLLWRYDYPAPVLTLRGSSKPTLAGNGVLVGVAGGRLLYLDIERGLPLWEALITPPSGRSEMSRIADIDADPLVVGERVYVGSYQGDLGAVDLVTGEVLWRRELSAYAGLTTADGRLYVTDSSDSVWAATIEDGAGIWKQEALRHRNLTAPVPVGNWLAVGDLEGWVHWIDRRSGRLAGRTRVGKKPISVTPVVQGNTLFVYADDGNLAALSPTSASKTLKGKKGGPTDPNAVGVPPEVSEPEDL